MSNVIDYNDSSVDASDQKSKRTALHKTALVTLWACVVILFVSFLGMIASIFDFSIIGR